MFLFVFIYSTQVARLWEQVGHPCIIRTINDGVTRARRVTSTSIVKELQLSISPLTVCRQMLFIKKLSRELCYRRITWPYAKKQCLFGSVKTYNGQKSFSDEKRFCHDGTDNWCSFVPKNVVLHRNKRQNGFRGIMVWGMVFPNG